VPRRNERRASSLTMAKPSAVLQAFELRELLLTEARKNAVVRSFDERREHDVQLEEMRDEGHYWDPVRLCWRSVDPGTSEDGTPDSRTACPSPTAATTAPATRRWRRLTRSCDDVLLRHHQGELSLQPSASSLALVAKVDAIQKRFEALCDKHITPPVPTSSEGAAIGEHMDTHAASAAPVRMGRCGSSSSSYLSTGSLLATSTSSSRLPTRLASLNTTPNHSRQPSRPASPEPLSRLDHKGGSGSSPARSLQSTPSNCRLTSLPHTPTPGPLESSPQSSRSPSPRVNRLGAHPRVLPPPPQVKTPSDHRGARGPCTSPTTLAEAQFRAQLRER